MTKKKFIIYFLTCLNLFGAGYKIPEQSSDATSLATSNIATSFGADAAYYNPANMVFLPDYYQFILSNQYIHAGVQKFKSKLQNSKNYDVRSKDGNFYMPSFHFVSPFFLDRFRFGLSLSSPAGISTRWSDPYPRSTAEIFSIKIAETTASLAYKIGEDLSFAAGIRGLYSKAKIKNRIDNYQVVKGFDISTKRDLRGDAKGLGYLLALTYHPIDNLSIASIYKSKIKMNFKADANGVDIKAFYNLFGREFAQRYIGSGNIKQYLPASLSIATSFKVSDFIFLFAYDKTFWSSLKDIDFDYKKRVPLNFMYDKKILRNYSNTDTYRFGIAYNYSQDLRLMAGFAYDSAASKSDKTGFELPDTSSLIYSAGLNYKVQDNLEFGLGYLYQHRKKRRVNHYNKFISFDNVVGEFDKNYISILNLSIGYRF